MSKIHVKKDDKVIVISGKDKGKTGKVLEVSPKEGKVIVEGINIASKHFKPKKQGDQGGIIQVEAPMYASKVMVVCPKCSKATRVGHQLLANGEKLRVCKKCGDSL